ncbi:MAG: hypothetical protein ACON4V_00940 [Parvibaculales bacterium]
MIKKVSFLFFGICFCLLIWSGNAFAQTPVCEKNSDGEVLDDFPGDGNAGSCQMPALYYEYTFQGFAVCKGFPILGSFANCQDLNVTPTQIVITPDSSSSLNGLLPLPGEYTHSVTRTSPGMKLSGYIEYQRPQLGGNAPGTNNWSTGRYCQLKPEDIVFSEVNAENFTYSTAFTYCQSTPFNESELTSPTLRLDDFRLSSDYQATNNPSFSEDYDFNAAALNGDLKLAATGAEVESLLLVSKLPAPLIVTDNHSTLEFTMSLEKGLSNHRVCTLNPATLNDPKCLVAYIWMGSTSLRVRSY